MATKNTKNVGTISGRAKQFQADASLFKTGLGWQLTLSGDLQWTPASERPSPRSPVPYHFLRFLWPSFFLPSATKNTKSAGTISGRAKESRFIRNLLFAFFGSFCG